MSKLNYLGINSNTCFQLVYKGENECNLEKYMVNLCS